MRTQKCLAIAVVLATALLTGSAADAQMRGRGFGFGRPMMMPPSFANSQRAARPRYFNGVSNRFSAGERSNTGTKTAHPDFAWWPTGRPTGDRFDGRYQVQGVTHRYSKKRGGRSIGGLKTETEVIESGGDADLRVRAGAPPTITRRHHPFLR